MGHCLLKLLILSTNCWPSQTSSGWGAWAWKPQTIIFADKRGSHMCLEAGFVTETAHKHKCNEGKNEQKKFLCS